MIEYLREENELVTTHKNMRKCSDKKKNRDREGTQAQKTVDSKTEEEINTAKGKSPK